MRIAHVLRKYDPAEWGGVETAVLQLVRGLRDAGADSVVYAPALERPSEVDDPFLEAGFVVRRYSARLPVIGISSEERERQIQVGGNILSLDLISQLLSAQVDLIHTHTLNRIGGAVRMASKLRNKPYVASIHGGYLDLPPRVADEMAGRGRRSFDWGKPFGMVLGSRKVVPDAAAVFAVNPHEAELLKEKFPNLRVDCMPLGIDPAPFERPQSQEAAVRFGIDDDQKVLLCVARIHSVKNQTLLVEGVRRLRQDFPNILLFLVGGVTEAAYAEQLEAAIARDSLEANVRLLPPLSPSDPALVGLYQRADLFTLASNAETFGLVLIEAALAATPFLASRTSGATHVASHCDTGTLFPIGDVDAFVAEARHLLNARPNRGDLEQSRKEVVSFYSKDAVAQRYLEHYRAVLAAHA